MTAVPISIMMFCTAGQLRFSHSRKRLTKGNCNDLAGAEWNTSIAPNVCRILNLASLECSYRWSLEMLNRSNFPLGRGTLGRGGAITSSSSTAMRSAEIRVASQIISFSQDEESRNSLRGLRGSRGLADGMSLVNQLISGWGKWRLTRCCKQFDFPNP